MEKKYTMEAYKNYVEMENEIYKLSLMFVDGAKQNMPDGYYFFDIQPCDISVRDARPYNMEKVMIILENKYGTTTQQMIVVNAAELMENPLQCAKNWIERELKIEDKRRKIAEARAEEEKKDYAEYQRLKRKYNWK